MKVLTVYLQYATITDTVLDIDINSKLRWYEDSGLKIIAYKIEDTYSL